MELYYKRLFTEQDCHELLDSMMGSTAMDGPPGKLALVDVPPTEGALLFCRTMVSRGWRIIILDHHLPEGNSPRDEEIKALSVEIGNVIDVKSGYRQVRSQHPGCSTLLEKDLSYDIVIADKDPDGLLSSMKLLGEDYPGLDSDCAILDGAPQLRNEQNLTHLGWLLNCCWSSLPSRDPKNPGPYEILASDLFADFKDAAAGSTHALDHLRSKARAFTDMVLAAMAAAETATEVKELPGWWLLDLRGKRADRGTFTRILEERGAKVIVSRLDTGVIASIHGEQFSAATTSLGQDINLCTFKPDKLVSSSETGVLSNVPFLLHMSPRVWDFVRWFERELLQIIELSKEKVPSR
jgi:hypothetical protein